MAKCSRCSNEIELSEMMKMLVAVRKAQGRSLGLLCPDCRPPDYIDPIDQVLNERLKERRGWETIDKATVDRWCQILENVLEYLELVWHDIEETKGNISKEDYDKYLVVYTEMKLVIPGVMEDLDPGGYSSLFDRNIAINKTDN